MCIFKIRENSFMVCPAVKSWNENGKLPAAKTDTPDPVQENLLTNLIVSASKHGFCSEMHSTFLFVLWWGSLGGHLMSLKWHHSRRHHVYVQKFAWAPAPSRGSLLEIASSWLVGAYGEWKRRPGAFPWMQVVKSYVCRCLTNSSVPCNSVSQLYKVINFHIYKN